MVRFKKELISEIILLKIVIDSCHKRPDVFFAITQNKMIFIGLYNIRKKLNLGTTTRLRY